MTQHSSHSGWVLDLVVQIDRDHPGFCGEFFRASAERRQVIAAFLSARPPAPEHAAEIAQFLLSAGHNSILNKTYGEAPQGLRGALRRAGPVVPEHRFFGILYKLLSRPPHAEVVKCINRFPSLDLMKLRVLDILPENLCRTNVVQALPDVQSASDLISAFKLLVESGADEELLNAAICAVGERDGLAKVMKKALLRCRAPEHPVASSDFYRPISTAQELHRTASRFRNCAKNYTIEFLDEEAGHAFGEACLGNESAMVHLRRRSGDWQIEGVFGPRNYRPSNALREKIYSYLAPQGIRVREREYAKSAWEPVRRVISNPIFGLDFE